MSLLRAVSTRLARSDFVQLGALFFAILLFSLIIVWPTNPAEANDTWFALSQARLICLALLSLGYGSLSADYARYDQRSAAGALLSLALLSVPLEVASYALSYPPQPLGYTLGVTLVDTLALFGVGLVVGKGLSLLRLKALLPLAVPGVLVGLVMADIALGFVLFNPLSALNTAEFRHLGMMGIIALLTLFYLSLKPSEPRLRAQPSSAR